MKKIILMTAIGLGALAFQACNNQQRGNDTKDSLDSLNDRNVVETTDNNAEFLTEAASGGMMEVELGKLVQEKSFNQKVKDFGAMMVKDHSAANDELKQLAMTKNVSLPDAPLPKHQDKINDLREKSVADFDKAYMSMMVDDHEDDIDEFQDATDNNKDPDVQAFASKTLPVLKAHLESAKSINDGIK